MNSSRIPVLVVDDEAPMLELLHDYLREWGFEPCLARNRVEAMAQLQAHEVPIVLADMHLPDTDGLEFVSMVRAHAPRIEVVLMADCYSVDSAVAAIHNGAFDYLCKPFSRERLKETMEKLRHRIESAFEAGRPEKADFHGIIGRSPAKHKAGPSRTAGKAELPLMSFEEAQRRLLAAALKETGGNRSQSAAILGVSRRTLYRLLDKFGFSSNRRAGAKRADTAAPATPSAGLFDSDERVVRHISRPTTANTQENTPGQSLPLPAKAVPRRELQILSEFALAATGTQALPAVLNVSVAHAMKTLGFDGAAIVLWSDETQEFRLGLARGFHNQGAPGDRVDLEVFSRQLDQAGFANWLAVLLRGQKQFKGLLFLGRKHETPARPQERELLETLGALIGIGIHNAQLFTQARLRTQQLLQSEKLAVLGQLFSGSMHEINNSLTTIQGFNELLLHYPLVPRARDYVIKMQGEMHRIGQIVRSLHAFVRPQHSEKMVVDLHELIEHVLALRAYSFKTSNIRLVRQFAPDLPCVLADPNQLEQVFLNLLNNTEQAMLERHGKGVLTVCTQSVCQAGVAFVRLTVLDDGPRVPEELRGCIFEPFFTRKLTGQGTGLDLSTCRILIREHGGRIYADANPGGGAALVVELPAIKQQPRKEVASAVGHAPVASFRPGRLLVVEDEKLMGEVLAELLAAAGHTVELALGAKSAISKLGHEVYDVIIADIKMPQLSGIDLYHLLQKTNPTLSDRVIFSTGDALSESTRKFLEETGSRYVLKPFHREQLLAQVQALLARPQQSAA